VLQPGKWGLPRAPLSTSSVGVGVRVTATVHPAAPTSPPRPHNVAGFTSVPARAVLTVVPRQASTLGEPSDDCQLLHNNCRGQVWRRAPSHPTPIAADCRVGHPGRLRDHTCGPHHAQGAPARRRSHSTHSDLPPLNHGVRRRIECSNRIVLMVRVSPQKVGNHAPFTGGPTPLSGGPLLLAAIRDGLTPLTCPGPMVRSQPRHVLDDFWSL